MKWLALLALALLVLVYLAAPVARAIIVAHPARSTVCCSDPSDYGLTYQTVSFQTANGLTVRGWYVPSKNKSAIIVAHGYLENRAAHLAPAVALAQHGYGILFIDLLAHGESDGSTLSLNGQEILAAVTFLKTQPNIDPTHLGVLGFSLGALVSLQAAAQTTDLRAVVADAPFPVSTAQDTPPPETLQDFLWLPFDFVQRLALAAQGASPYSSTVQALQTVAPRPVLLIAGTQNPGEARVLRNYFTHASPNTTFWEIPEAGHLGGWSARPQEYAQRLIAFFDRVLQSE